MAPPPEPNRSRSRRQVQRWLDLLFSGGTGVIAVLSAVLVIAIAYVLLQNSLGSIELYGPGFLTGKVWDFGTNTYGALPFIVGTLVTSGIAMLFGVPVSLGIAIFLSQDARGRVATVLASMVELLAAIPSVVYGFWALFVIVPIMHYNVEPELHAALGRLPLIGGLFPGGGTGLDVLTAGVILSIMVIPTISAVSRETMAAVPHAQREAALALGATRWETTRTSVLPYARAGIVGAVVLGLGRAMGETMAVLMTIGSNTNFPTSLFSTGNSIASAIANYFPEDLGQAARSALLEAALLLLAISIVVNLIARLLIRGLHRRAEVNA